MICFCVKMRGLFLLGRSMRASLPSGLSIKGLLDFRIPRASCQPQCSVLNALQCLRGPSSSQRGGPPTPGPVVSRRAGSHNLDPSCRVCPRFASKCCNGGDVWDSKVELEPDVERASSPRKLARGKSSHEVLRGCDEKPNLDSACTGNPTQRV